MILLLCFLTIVPTFASVPFDFFENKIRSDLKEKVSPIPFKIDEIALGKETSAYGLQRFDLDLSLSASLGIMVFSKDVEKAIELVWERKKNEVTNFDEIEDINMGASPEETAEIMLPHVMKVLSELKANNKVKRKVIKRIYRDARKISRYVKAIQTFNGKESWYIGNYFKNYYFSISGEILGSGVSYDKRLRFRFKTPTPLVLSNISKRLEKRIHRRLTRMARHFLAVQSLDGPEHRFAMNRVRTVEGFEGNVNFGLGEVSYGRGILLEWFPGFQASLASSLKRMYPPQYLRSLATSIESVIPDTKNFELSQIRIKGSLESELSFLIMSVSKFREIEYHYRLKK
jgi:hypothetical protein